MAAWEEVHLALAVDAAREDVQSEESDAEAEVEELHRLKQSGNEFNSRDFGRFGLVSNKQSIEKALSWTLSQGGLDLSAKSVRTISKDPP
jgi:hypothetical protein